MYMNKYNLENLFDSTLDVINSDNSTASIADKFTIAEEITSCILNQVSEMTSLSLGSDTVIIHDIDILHGSVNKRSLALTVNVVAQVGPIVKTIAGPTKNQLNAVVFKMPIEVFYELKKELWGTELKVVTPYPHSEHGKEDN